MNRRSHIVVRKVIGLASILLMVILVGCGSATPPEIPEETVTQESPVAKPPSTSSPSPETETTSFSDRVVEHQTEVTITPSVSNSLGVPTTFYLKGGSEVRSDGTGEFTLFFETEEASQAACRAWPNAKVLIRPEPEHKDILFFHHGGIIDCETLGDDPGKAIQVPGVGNVVLDGTSVRIIYWPEHMLAKVSVFRGQVTFEAEESALGKREPLIIAEGEERAINIATATISLPTKAFLAQGEELEFRRLEEVLREGTSEIPYQNIPRSEVFSTPRERTEYDASRDAFAAFDLAVVDEKGNVLSSVESSGPIQLVKTTREGFFTALVDLTSLSEGATGAELLIEGERRVIDVRDITPFKIVPPPQLSIPPTLVPAAQPEGPPFLASLYDKVLDTDANGRPMPALARGWEVSSKGDFLTLYLHDGVSLHDGRPLTADLVAEILENDTVLAHDVTRRSLVSLRMISGSEVVDEFAVKLELTAPAPQVLSALGGLAGMVGLPLEATGVLAGAGPFELVEFKDHESLELKAFADYWGGKPSLDRLLFLEVPESATRVAAMRAGEAQVLVGESGKSFDFFSESSEFVVCGTTKRYSAVSIEVKGFECLPNGRLDFRRVSGIGAVTVVVPSLVG